MLFEKHRRSIRLPEYDYSETGAYFITICTQEREFLFGEIINGEMQLNDAGKMIEMVWNDIPKYYKTIEIDAFQIMPNHFHGNVMITNNNNNVGATPRGCPKTDACGQAHDACGQAQGPAPTKMTLPDVVHRFKTLTTKKYVDNVNQNNWPPFDRRLWQRNYFEHIIRDEQSLNRIREYIVTNPLRWSLDQNNENDLTEFMSAFEYKMS